MGGVQSHVIRRIFIGIVSVIVLDVVWLGVVMKSFYREQLGPIALTAVDGSLAPIWAAAVPVYLLMGIGVAVFVSPRVEKQPVARALAWGALYGLILFGVYDLTNLATLRGYSPLLAAVDIAWGAGSSALTTLAIKLFDRRAQ